MPSLDTLLDSLCRNSASLAFQSSTVQTYQCTSSTQTFTAPFDGYAVVVSAGIANTEAINFACGTVQVYSPSYLSSWICLWLPIRKGFSITVRTNGSTSTYPTLRLVKARLAE